MPLQATSNMQIATMQLHNQGCVLACPYLKPQHPFQTQNTCTACAQLLYEPAYLLETALSVLSQKLTKLSVLNTGQADTIPANDAAMCSICRLVPGIVAKLGVAVAAIGPVDHAVDLQLCLSWPVHPI